MLRGFLIAVLGGIGFGTAIVIFLCAVDMISWTVVPKVRHTNDSQ
jgi:hypothetical protein